MALKVLMLRKRLDDAEKSLASLREKDEGFETREAELETAISEAQTDDERSAVEGMVDAFETEKRSHDEAKTALEGQIETLRADLAAEETKQREAAKAVTLKNTPDEGRRDGGTDHMNIRDKFFNLSVQERDALFAREEVRSWIDQVRVIMGRRDAGGVTNAAVLIPQVMLPYLRQLIEEHSKMLKHTNLARISGEGRMVIDGGFPEAVWTDMCGTLNELTLGYYDVEIFGWKVGGFIQVCNALLEDSDIALASDILSKLGQSIGYALDKAILYGTGTKMPLGIVTRLAQTDVPSDYPATGRPWRDLHSTNIVSVSAANSTGVKLFQSVVEAFGAASNRFTRGSRFWTMNETTLSAFLVQGMAVNASGVIVSAMGDTMPVIGGKIETLDFIPDNVVIGGYDGLYLLAERAGMKTGQSEHYKFVEDKTVFKATARYDGKPVIPEGFVVIGIKGVTPTASMSFSPDAANTAPKLSALTIGALSLSPTFDAAKTSYTTSTTDATNKVTATAENAGDKVKITVNGAAVDSGESATWNTGTNTVLATVTNSYGLSTTYTVVVIKSAVNPG